MCIIPDISGRAYGTFLFDSTTAVYLTAHINEFSDPLLRGILWINMYENLVNGTVSPADFFKAAFSALETEKDLQLRNYLSGRFSSAYWNFLSDDERTAASANAEAMSAISSQLLRPHLKREHGTSFTGAWLSLTRAWPG